MQEKNIYTQIRFNFHSGKDATVHVRENSLHSAIVKICRINMLLIPAQCISMYRRIQLGIQSNNVTRFLIVKP